MYSKYMYLCHFMLALYVFIIHSTVAVCENSNDLVVATFYAINEERVNYKYPNIVCVFINM